MNKEVSLILLIFIYIELVHSSCTPSITSVSLYSIDYEENSFCSGELIFNEEFNELNEDIWYHELTVNGNGNGEFEEYVNDRSVSYTKDGVLYIKPKIVGDVPLHDGYFNPVQSARLNTAGRFAFLYGKIEVRAKLPTGDWLWPAIWMKPQDNIYGLWPVSGELDIMESRGNENFTQNGLNIGPQLMFSTAHWGRNRSDDRQRLTHYEQRNKTGYNTNFHKYQMEWTPDFMSFSLDDQELGRVTPPSEGFYELGNLTGCNPWINGTKMAPFDKTFFILINLAVGSTSGYFPDNGVNPNGKPWKNWSKQAAKDFWNGNSQWRPTWNEKTTQSAFQVDYIKIWAL